MTSIYTDIKTLTGGLMLLTSVLATGCGGGSGSSSAGIQAALSASPNPATAATIGAGNKMIMNDLGDTIMLSKAYLVISNLTIETDCTDPSFSAGVDRLLNFLIPTAQAHTSSTPTSTGVPIVIDMLSADGTLIDLGTLAPPSDDYCGGTINLDVADSDALNLPTGFDMIGKSLHLEGTFNGSNDLSFTVSVPMIERKMLFSALMMLSSANLNGSATVEINYDTWFDGLDPSALDDTNLSAPASNQLLQNITASLHQL